jgi:maleamate amidohydrolase
MSLPLWTRFLTERDKAVLAASGLGANIGFGKRPALLVLDVCYGFTGDKPEPILQSIKRWGNSCGAEAWEAIPVIRRLIDRCHDKRIPVVYTHGGFRDDRWDAGSWAWKNRRTAEWKAPAKTGIDSTRIVAEVAPAPQDIVVPKLKPSGFFGTALQSHLTLLQCDSLIVVGGATSGCVRATVVDAFSLNYRVSLVEDACFDRLESSHAITLCDLQAKYADVLRHEAVLDYLTSLSAGLFDLPAGAHA